MKTLISVVAITFIAVSTHAAIIYVDDGASGVNNGSSWTDAYTYLQDAMHDPLLAYGDEIWVAEGTYTPDSNSINPGGTGDREATFRLVNGVGLYGGFPDSEDSVWEDRDPNTYETVLSGDLADNDGPGEWENNEDNSYHVVVAGVTDPNAVLDGFTVTAGNASGDTQIERYGGGMYCDQANLTIKECKFISNFSQKGCGIYNIGGHLELIDCGFSWNYAKDGGGLYNEGSVYLENCSFKSNKAAYFDHGGGGLYNYSGDATLINCDFTDNESLLNGGGLVNDNGITELTGCTFSNNKAWPFIGGSYPNLGGGIYSDGGSLILTNCTFINNEGKRGAGVYGNGTLNNCVFIGNLAHNEGGGMYGNGTLTNCMFIGNCSENDGAGMYGEGTLMNCSFIGNKADDEGGAIKNDTWPGGPIGYVTLNNCTLSGNSADNAGCIYTDFDMDMKNCIVWDNNSISSDTQIYLGRYYLPLVGTEVPTTMTVNYSDIQNGQTCVEGGALEWELGNIDEEPLFVLLGYHDPNGVWAEGDYHLKSTGWRWDTDANDWTWDDATSRCIDAGNPGSPLADEPLNLEADPLNRLGENIRINMGAYGGTAEASMPPYDWTLLSDINNDGIANLPDFAEVGQEWLTSGDSLPCDFNRDGGVGLDDVMLMTQDWLKQTSWY